MNVLESYMNYKERSGAIRNFHDVRDERSGKLAKTNSPLVNFHFQKRKINCTFNSLLEMEEIE